MKKEEILKSLPYSSPFLFVDTLEYLDDDSAEGSYTFVESLPFYQGHFKGNPVTPGVILTECCAQIGLVCLGIFLAWKEGMSATTFLMNSAHMDYYIPVYPGEKVRVHSKKQYFRFGKLKCDVAMYNHRGKLVCKGVLSGMIIQTKNE